MYSKNLHAKTSRCCCWSDISVSVCYLSMILSLRDRLNCKLSAGKSNAFSAGEPSSTMNPVSHQILCCAYNANGTVFVTGSSDTFARVSVI